MANIDLQSLISQLSVSTGAQPGGKASGQASAAGQLFGNILGQQQTLQTGDVATGKALPGGNGLPILDGKALSGVTPEMAKVAQALAQLAENPQAAGSLPLQELQTQLKQLLQAEDGMANETSLDDLSALTNLLMAADAAPTLPAKNSVDGVVTAQGINNDSVTNAELNDEQLLQTAATMGVDPTIAATVLNATQVVVPQVAAPVLPSSTNALQSHAPLTAAQVLATNNASADILQQPSVAQSVADQVKSNAQTTVSQAPANGQPVLDQVASNARPVADRQQPVTINPTAQAQPAAQHITDDVVIQVRQATQQASQQGQPAQVASSVSAQEFFQQRVGRNAASSATVSVAQATEEPGVIRLADNLINKLDQLNSPAPSTNTESTLQAGSQLSGASFKSMAQFSQTSGFANTGAAVPTAEVPVTEGGSRLQTLMQGDTAAQQAARNMQNQVGQQLQRMVRDGQWQANINLNPARLGQIRINMTMEDGVLTTQLLSANQGVRELLEGGMPRLRELLEESGLQLGQFDVGSDAGNQQQFAQQEENNGVVTQVASADQANTAEAVASQSQHDGDLDTFA